MRTANHYWSVYYRLLKSSAEKTQIYANTLKKKIAAKGLGLGMGVYLSMCCLCITHAVSQSISFTAKASKNLSLLNALFLLQTILFCDSAVSVQTHLFMAA